MMHKEIPFRPKLEGVFRARFYNAVSTITEKTSITECEAIADREITWVEDSCLFNLQQRKKYRAIWYLLRDLLRASWKAVYRDGVLYMSLPSLNGKDAHDSTSPEVKALLRQWMAESRHESLLTNKDFVDRMENPAPTKKSVTTLIADGNELVSRLSRIKAGTLGIKEGVKPYLQLVTDTEKDSYTGLKISDIWRYFRLTWSTPYETTPGRTVQYLVRDAAEPNNAVIGIASLENCAVQITSRDDYLGWNAKAFIEKTLKMQPKDAKVEFQRLLKYLQSGIDGIDWSSLCTKEEIENPTQETIERLVQVAQVAEAERQESLKQSEKKVVPEKEKSDLGRISKTTEVALYQRKRADQLSKYLKAKKILVEELNSEDFEKTWIAFCNSEEGTGAIRAALVAQKTQHIGSSMMELNVCGAIPPYNEILGGKLVALLATSPQVIHDYKERYANRPSEIASRLKGKPVCRPADLVYIGTTSLYYVGSSQYNRLKIPGSVFGSDFDIDWKQIGMTLGFGTMHISKATTMALTEATSDGFRRINHVFGEGASPKMRLLSMAIRELLESTTDDSKDFSKHAMSRIVYGVFLAKNATDYLLGLEKEPKYYTDVSDWKAGTQKIIDFWSDRWLASRLNFDPIFERIPEFQKASILISNQISEEPWTFKKLKEGKDMLEDEKETNSLDFIRNFYRGASAYADNVDQAILSEMHIKTKLDDAILESIETKDIVLTGNPGDGKTHIIRMLKDAILKKCPGTVIETDASTLMYDEIFDKWNEARNQNKRFVIAINAAVLYTVYQNHQDFEPLKSAYKQMSHSIVFHDEKPEDSDVVVFDLSKREVITKDILRAIISKLTDEKYYPECRKCKLDGSCDVYKNRKLLNNELFQERLFLILKRVTLTGYHATLRELQNFISFLIFGDRPCSKLMKSTGENEYDLANLVFSGKGRLFDAVRLALDPINVSHPIWDEKILNNSIDPSTWIDDFQPTKEAIAFDNCEQFNLRKRQFYFFNTKGSELIDIMDDDETRFQDFLSSDNKKIIKELIKKLNVFFGAEKASNTDLQIWTGHRFDNEPRKVLISTGSIKSGSLQIGRPTLSSEMQKGIDTSANYVRFEKKDSPNIFLKIDFGMYVLLSRSERGVPVLFMESDRVKKVWRFIEQLQSKNMDYDDEMIVSLLDIQNKNKIVVKIDTDDSKYSEIECGKMKED